MRERVDEALRFLASPFLGNVLLVALLVLNVGIHSSQEQILVALKKGERLVSTTYTDIYGMQHTVNSPTQPTPGENVRVHREYLKEAFCSFTPQNPPSWWSPEDCP